jgi:tRNA threonylcarbamoyladenosine biosynthesis protein TsaB
MIDARRMEVFTAIFDAQGQYIMPSSPMILTSDSFNGWLEERQILFLGNGAQKFKEICIHPNARFSALNAGAAELIRFGMDAFQHQQFSNTAYAEPFYGKAFHSTQIQG